MGPSFSFSHLSAGFIAVLVGYTSSAAIIFQAATAAGATAAQLGSWLWALGIGMGATCIGLSLRYRAPVLTAWSTPGAALLVTALSGVPMNEAIGAFLFSSLLITVCGVSGWFEKLMHRIPRALAAAMLAGVLLRFGLDAFASMGSRLALVGAMLLVYLVIRRLLPRYAVPLTLLAGLVVASVQGLIRFEAVELEFASPVFTLPAFSPATLIGVGLPLFVVTMASQNVPGVAVLRANGYSTPVSPLVGWTGATGVVLAPFGGYAFNLAAITAAICMGREAHEDPARRYTASAMAGLFYIAIGLAGGAVVGLLTAFPRELIAAVAGLALLGTIAGGLSAALKDERHRDAAILTFLVTLSGLSLLGIGSAFWGVVAGAVSLLVQHFRSAPRQ